MSSEPTSSNIIFLQGLPREGTFELIGGDKHSTNLLYKDTGSLQIYKVPNTWYNHPVKWRVEHFSSFAKQYEQQAREIAEKQSDGNWKAQSESLMKISKECSNLADEMARTGKVIA